MLAAVTAAAPAADISETRTLQMRYRGQGHNLAVNIGNDELTNHDAARLLEAFREKYISVYRRPLDGMEVECVGLSLRMSARADAWMPENVLDEAPANVPAKTELYFLLTDSRVEVPSLSRQDPALQQPFSGPVLIKDRGTTINVPTGYETRVDASGHIIIQREETGAGGPVA